ncbi:MAG TPA: response regulator [Myxococcota bacterium]|nr:response regulator [Myxococcota bacterium]HRY93387.1 response regulator [Myxococcota bacterium]HSA20375.1 response regulator [Myxococcota bacterium]
MVAPKIPRVTRVNSGRETLRFLVVDDEDVVRGVVRSALERPGVFLVEAADGEEAIRLLLAEHFDLILVDKNLPGITGLDVIRRARAVHPRIGTLLITGFASRESAEEALVLGVDAYLVKPFDIAELQERVDETLGRRSTPVEAPPPRVGLRISRRRVLVCDPSPASAEILRVGVEMLGHQAELTMDMSRVIQAIRDKRLDTLVCDLELISRNEASACFLRSALWTAPQVGFVAVAAQRGLDGAIQAIQRGATQVVYRPLGTASDVARNLEPFLGRAAPNPRGRV